MSVDDPGKSNYIKPSEFPGRTDKYDLTISPTPHRSGRTAEEIIAATVQEVGLLNNAHGIGASSRDELFRDVETELQACQRQLFDAMMEIVGENDEHNATHNPDYPKEKGYGSCSCDLQPTNHLRAELRQRLRVFFNQSAEDK